MIQPAENGEFTKLSPSQDVAFLSASYGFKQEELLEWMKKYFADLNYGFNLCLDFESVF